MVEALITGSYALTTLAFSRPQLVIEEHLIKWARDILSDFKEWFPYVSTEFRNSSIVPGTRIQQITLAAFVTLCILAVRQRHYDQAWACLLNGAKFFHASLHPTTDLFEVIKDVLQGVKQPETSYNQIKEDLQIENNDEDLNDTMEQNDDPDALQNEINELEITAKILEIATINHLVFALEMFLQNCQPQISEDLEPFIKTAYLEPMLNITTKMERELSQSLPGLGFDNIVQRFKDPAQKQFWNSLTCINEPQILLPTFSTTSALTRQ
ncbi:hypothetical protein G9A89_005498 [Geosiphon pyriformis]|nr:hypothetical protein G9A89_005498 [Geosiphon pyriformis]